MYSFRPLAAQSPQQCSVSSPSGRSRCARRAGRQLSYKCAHPAPLGQARQLEALLAEVMWLRLSQTLIQEFDKVRQVRYDFKELVLMVLVWPSNQDRP